MEDDYKIKREKDSISLLKQKMCKTHDLIKQYAKNMKQINDLKSDLENAKKDKKHMITNYGSSLHKIRELELKIGEDKKRDEKREQELENKINEYEIKTAADKQTIQQLECKIKQLEDECSAKVMEYELQKSIFEDKIKDLEHECKKSKAISIPKKKEKKIISTDSDIAKPSIGIKLTSDIGINASLGDNELSVKRKVQDKSILTDEFYNIKDDPHPLFCAKCEAHLSPDLTPEKICKTMSTFPELIERDLSPLSKKIFSPLCSLPSTYPDSTNRMNEDALSRTSMPQSSSYSSYSNSIVDNSKFQLEQSSTMAQICENVELSNMDISHIPVVASSPNNLGSIPTTLTLSQKSNYARENFCSNDLLVEHSSSIKEMEKKIQLLESKMKKFRRLKEKVDNNSCCRCSKNCKDDISLNTNLISIICKSMAEYYDEKKEACFRNKRNVDSEPCTCSMKKAKLNRRQQLHKSNACKNTCLCKIENRDDKYQLRDTFCNNTENAAKTIDISQCEHTLSVHKNNLLSDTFNTSLNDTDEFDKREFVSHEKSTLHSTEVASVEDSLTSYLSADESVNDNFLDKDNVEAMDVDNNTGTETILFSDENYNDHTYSKIVEINAEENEMRNKGKNIHEDKVDEIYASVDNLLNKDDSKTIGMDNQTKTGTIFLFNAKHSTYHAAGKIVDINAEKNKVKNKGQNIHIKDKVGEIHASNNLLNKDNIKANDMDNQTKTGTIFVSKNENSTDHADGKIVDINAEKNKINKSQNVHKDKIDEIYASDNLLSKDNIEAMDNQTITERTSLSKDENSINNHADSKIIDINAEENKMKRKNIQKGKVSDIKENRLLKKIRNLKRKTRANLPINKHENIESYSDHSFEYNNLAKKSRIENEEESGGRSLENSINDLQKKLNTRIESINKQDDNKLCSDDYEPVKKLRIAHTPKTSVSQLSSNENNVTHSTIRNIASSMTQRSNGIPQLGIRKSNLLTKSKKSRTLNEKCDEKNVKSTETNSIDGRPVKNEDLTSTENCLQNNDIALSAINTKRVSEFEKCDDVLIKDTNNRSIPMDRVIGETSNNNGEPNVLHNNIANDSDDLESVPLILRLKALSNSSILCKKDRLTKALKTNKNKKEITPIANEDLETLGNKSHDDHKISKDVISNGESSVLHDRSNVPEAMRKIKKEITPTAYEDLETLGNESHDDHKISKDLISNGESSVLHDRSNVFEAMRKIKKEITPTAYEDLETLGNKIHDDHKISKDVILKCESSVLHDRSNVLEATRNKSHNNSNVSDGATEILRSPSPRDSGIVVDYTNDTNDTNSTKESLDQIKEETCVNNETNGDKEMKFFDATREVEKKLQTPKLQLIKYISQKRVKKYKMTHAQIEGVIKITDRFVKKQLRRLISSAWEEAIHDDIIKKLGSTCGPRIIAKCIVEFLLEEVDHDEALDKSFTPPAPLMTKFEQKIIVLLIDLEVSKPTVIYFVQAAIEYNLFRLTNDKSTMKIPVNLLTRIYVVLSRLQKDREKVRMMCCNALYCMGLKSIGVLYTVLTCWPEVLPNAEANKGILPKCIAFLISSLQIKNPYSIQMPSVQKLNILKDLLSRFYKYNFSQETTSDIVKELITTLKAERVDGLDTAIILVAKKGGSSWTYKNIIESSLLPMIIRNEHPCIYSAFSLLGRLLRAFTSENEDNAVKISEISEQLCDLIKSGQGSHDQQEGIISALLSLSRQKFNVVTPCVLKWEPNKPLRPIVNTQLQAFIKARDSKFWNNYL
ncbi:uncharacterized protein LOC143907423 isoform X2 [Temnothorax americanus]|uniref:uncharacterized protein LOC143907423 isoform X2 n=1 Tax=Temnothorax americanus TaxID=1964332 RepID=UPI0040682867